MIELYEDTNSLPIVDFHCDTLLKSFRKLDLSESNPGIHLDFPRLSAGGVKLQVMALWAADERYKPARAAWQTMRLIDEFHRQVAKSDRVVHVMTKRDLAEVLAKDQIGLLLSIEGGEALEGDLAMLRIFHRLGVRAVTLTWSERNELGDGISEVAGGGLTRFGREVVTEMERLGMIVDVSHLSETGFWNVITMATRPVIASHSNAKALCKDPRNLRDDQLKAIAATGGVIGINFFPGFLADSGKASVKDIVRHMAYIAVVTGWEHVGLGSDFDGISSAPEGLEDPSKYPNLVKALVAEGLTPEQIRNVMGGNFLRLLEASLPD